MTPRTNQLTAVSILSLSLLTMAPGAVAATVPAFCSPFQAPHNRWPNLPSPQLHLQWHCSLSLVVF
jgi:hypothetical protein